MHLECPLCAHVSSMDLIPCVLKVFNMHELSYYFNGQFFVVT
jgi:hypothetical protein